MKENLTEVVFILDMSGSMQSLTADTIGGYNTLLEEQRHAKGDANVTTVLFDDRYIKLHDRVPINDVKPITSKEYQPLGTTAMLDAVGKTIIAVGQQLDALPEEEKPEKVIVTIITDGYENASKEYSWNQVQKLIKQQREKYNWIFTFIGANIDVMKVSDSLGIDHRLAKAYGASKAGVDSVYRAMSSSVSKLRATSYYEDAAAREKLIDELDKDLSETLE